MEIDEVDYRTWPVDRCYKCGTETQVIKLETEDGPICVDCLDEMFDPPDWTDRFEYTIVQET